MIEVPLDQVDNAVQSWIEGTMPKYRAQPGYRGFTLIDRQKARPSGLLVGGRGRA